MRVTSIFSTQISPVLEAGMGRFRQRYQWNTLGNSFFHVAVHFLLRHVTRSHCKLTNVPIRSTTLERNVFHLLIKTFNLLRDTFVHK